MNHEGEASSSATGAHNAHNDHGERSHPSEAPQTASQIAERKKKNRELFNRKRQGLLKVLSTDLDTIIYAELGAVYYME
jgi:hypothetical protein